jgi:hypothetical protein
MESAAKRFLDTNREKLSNFASSQVYFSWADAAIEQGADIDNIIFSVMRYNIEGGN